jgi:hypothetical protein
MELVNIESIEGVDGRCIYRDKDSLIGVDLRIEKRLYDDHSEEERIFCQLFLEALNKERAKIRTAKNRLVLEYRDDKGQEETRTFQMSRQQALKVSACLADSNYRMRVGYLNGGYDALAIRFIRIGSTMQTLLIKKEGN